MAITNYSQLQTAIANWMNRNDLTTVIPDFITLAEKKLFRDLRLHQWEQRAYTDTVAGTAYIARPTDSAGFLSIKLTTDPIQNLRHVSNEYMDSRYLGSENGQPEVYTIVGDELRLAPTPDSVYRVEISYIQEPTPLSDSNTTNWYTTNAPDLILYASLIEGAPYIRDYESIQVWAEYLNKSRQEVLKRDRKIKYPQGSVMRARVI